MFKFHKHSINVLMRRFYSISSNESKINVDYLREKLSKYNVPNYYEKHLSTHKNISRFKKRASVLIPISVRKELDQNSGREIEKTYYTLSKRTDSLSSHKGEVCFLGGKKDNEFESDVETAYREAGEEANVNPNSLTFVAQLCPIISYQQILVTPVIAYFDKSSFKPVLNEKEVEMIFDLETERFLTNQNHKTKTISNQGGHYHIHYFKDVINGKTIHTWGMTAFLAIVVSALLHSKPPDFDLILGKNLDIDNINKYLEQFLFAKLAVSDASSTKKI